MRETGVDVRRGVRLRGPARGEMRAGLPVWAEQLVALRVARGWIEADLARELKGRRGDDLPSIKSLAHMIRSDWESGKHKPGPRYRLLLSDVYGTDEDLIFGDRPPTAR